MEWKAWYITMPVQHKVLRFYSDIHKWSDLPKDGAIAFQYGDIKLYGYDWYFRLDTPQGEIFGADNEVRTRNIYEEITQRYPNADIFRGIWIPTPLMESIQKELWQSH